MKISTRGRYALRLMLDLALRQEGERPVSLRDVSGRQGISEKYLEQIVTPLCREGLLRGVRGAGGGYLLTRPAEAYTVGEILRPLEGDLRPVECAGGGDVCGYRKNCVTVEVWDEIYRAVNEVVDRITLRDLADRYRQKTGTPPAPVPHGSMEI